MQLLPLAFSPPLLPGSFLPFKLKPIVLAMGGAFQSLDLAPLRATHMRLAVKQPSPRNSKSPYPMERQREIYEAARERQARREAKRVGIDPDSTDF